MRKTITRIIALALALVTCIGLLPTGASAASYSRSAMDDIMDSWNATTYSESNKCTSKYLYQGAYQCAAFSRYAFMQLYGHKDTTNNSNNTVTTKTYTTSAALLSDLKTLAAPGDAIRFTNTKNTSHTHIFNLSDIDTKGNITVYESNKDGKTNKAYCKTYGSIAKLVNNGTGVRTVSGKFSSPVEMKIIHSKKNTTSAGSFTGNNIVTITLNTHGGTVSNPIITAAKNGKYGNISTPERDGYIFKGWYTAASGGKKITSFTKLTSNSAHTLHARWDKCSHKEYCGGICKTCGHEYNCKVTAMKATAYTVTRSGSAPVWNRPYSNNAQQMDRLNKGATVIVIGKTVNQAGNTWFLLSDGTWCYSGNLKKASMPKNVRYVSSTDGLNIRSTASTSGKKLDTIPAGGFVIINPVKRKGNWIYVTYPASNVSGWVSAKYLTTKAPTANK